MLRAVIHDGAREVERFTSRPFGVADLTNGRIAITEHWRPAKLWDTDAPNQYVLRVSLADVRSAVLDEALPVKFRISRVLDRGAGLLPERHPDLSFGDPAR
jgi:hypothetical protein